MERGQTPVAGAVAVETSELRWFFEGQLPPDVMSCFTRAGTTGLLEERYDIYRMDGRGDMGVKRRYRETLELKVCQSAGEHFVLGTGLAGQLELWRRWSPADGLVASVESAPWIEVHKTIVKRRFSVEGEEISISEDSRAMTGAGCDVEIAAVTVGNIEAWTFAFAAYGPARSREISLVRSWQALDVGTPLMEHLGLSVERSCGYPEWLAIAHRASGASQPL